MTFILDTATVFKYFPAYTNYFDKDLLSTPIFLSLNILEFKIVEEIFWCSHIWPFRFYCEKNIQ